MPAKMHTTVELNACVALSVSPPVPFSSSFGCAAGRSREHLQTIILPYLRLSSLTFGHRL
eukprot:748304-Amphidinium_carterae.1